MPGLPEGLKTIFAPRRKYTVAVAGLAFCLGLLAQMALVFGQFGGEASGLVSVGDYFYSRGVERLVPGDIYVHQNSNGYDGQFFFYQAHDPFLRKGVEDFLDNPDPRTWRMAYPFLIGIFSLGQSSAMPWAMMFLNLAALAGCVWMLGERARERGWSPWLALLFVTFSSTTMTLSVLTSELVASLFVLLSFLGYERRRPWHSAGFALAALLTKEFCVFWIFCVLLWALWRRKGKWFIAFILVLFCWAGWVGYAKWQTRPEPVVSVEKIAPGVEKTESPALSRLTAYARYRLQFFGVPFRGLAVFLGDRFQNWQWSYLHELGILFSLIALGLHGILRLKNRERRSPPDFLFALLGFMMLWVEHTFWEWSGNFARQFFLLPLVAFWVFPVRKVAWLGLGSYAFFSMLKFVVKALPRIF